MKKRNLASMLMVAGGLTLATAACSSPAAEEPIEATSEEATMDADATSVADCGAASCEAQPCAAAGCAAAPCAAAGCAAKPCAAAGCAAKQ